MSDGKLPVLHQRRRCVYHGRQLGRSGVTSTALHGKENSVRHQICHFHAQFRRVWRHPRIHFGVKVQILEPSCSVGCRRIEKMRHR